MVAPSHLTSHRAFMSTSGLGIALVTGAAKGIGKAVALRLAEDGFDVAVNDIAVNAQILAEVVDEIKAKGRSSSAHIADVSVDGEVKDMVETVVKIHGGLDVMVANAGIIKWASLVNTTVEDWDRVMTVNVRGSFLCYKYAAIQMIKQGRGGRIIGASSVGGKKGGGSVGAYCPSKFAIRGLTQAAAQELGPHGITVNAYAPGTIMTDMTDYLDSEYAKATQRSPGGFIEILKNSIPLKKVGTAADVANFTSFIASKDSQFITGTWN
ncbi:hypothetical protein C8J57DRAFT_1326967 [Mycena rebaudengoi]|nr:hypothetical protein C8J57DRAFT_1326967 [Mycena rebaudengoi]